MKLKFLTLALLLVAGAFFQSCNSDSGTSGPGPTGTPTPIPAATFTTSGSNTWLPATSPNPVTIAAGESALWTFSSPHNLVLDGNCPVTLSGPSYIQTFSTPGTYLFHCAVHAPCGASCTSCTGMIGTLVVQ